MGFFFGKCSNLFILLIDLDDFFIKWLRLRMMILCFFSFFLLKLCFFLFNLGCFFARISIFFFDFHFLRQFFNLAVVVGFGLLKLPCRNLPRIYLFPRRKTLTADIYKLILLMTKYPNPKLPKNRIILSRIQMRNQLKFLHTII